jgi:nitronate monooxygenase
MTAGLLGKLALPLMCAPMSLVSSPALAAACCRAGVLGGWQGGTLTPFADFERYLEVLAEVDGAPPIVNVPARIASEPTGEPKLALLEKYRVPLVLCSLGDPSLLIERVHGWGGRLIQDVTTMRHAEKAIAAGVDGLMLTCSGAGGHTGFLTPFAFVPAVRRLYDGPMIVAGGIADGAGIAAVLALGADIACMGTRFIATPESAVAEGYRQMIATTGIDQIVTASAMNGVPANWLLPSIEAAGLDYAQMPRHRTPMPDGKIPWRDIWSAGHSVALIDQVEPVAAVVDRLAGEFARTGIGIDWRARLARLEARLA